MNSTRNDQRMKVASKSGQCQDNADHAKLHRVSSAQTDMFTGAVKEGHHQTTANALIDLSEQVQSKVSALRRAVIGLLVAVVFLTVLNIIDSVQAPIQRRAFKEAFERGAVRTTSKELEFIMEPLPPRTHERHRSLQIAANMICENADSDMDCKLQGYLKLPDAIQLYRSFCPAWPNLNNICQGEGPEKLNLNCNGAHTVIHGGLWIPRPGPTMETFANSTWLMFPSSASFFVASQAVYDIDGGIFQKPCILDYWLGFACDTAMEDCVVLAAHSPAECPGYRPSVCGSTR